MAHKRLDKRISSTKRSYNYTACMKIMWNACLNSWNKWDTSSPTQMGNKGLSFWNEQGKRSYKTS